MEKINDDIINIAFCIDENYAKFMNVTLISILENNKDNYLQIHILTDYLSKKEKSKIRDIINNYKNVSYKLYIVDDTKLLNLKTNRWSIHTWYRILLPSLLPREINRVLYLDADTLVTSDLKHLFKIKLENIAIGGVLSGLTFNQETYIRCGYPKEKQYICAGVLLINLEYWRKNNLTEKIIDWAKVYNERLVLPDQDAINFICQDNKKILPLKYGILNEFFKNENFFKGALSNELKECITNPKIIHFACKPWLKDSERHIMDFIWHKYNSKLPNPVKSFYSNNSVITNMKIIIWRLFHPDCNRPLHLQDIILKFMDVDNKFNK